MSAASCVFCRIVNGEIPATIVHRDDQVTAFRDIEPRAPVHVLIIPNQHLSSLAAAGPQHGALLGVLLQTVAAIARQEGIATSGYRVVINAGADAGESVPHLHVHLLGGRALAWPPG
jgi:histidine triad (HIT) family protein